MAEERIKQINQTGSGKAEGRGPDSSKEQRELTPEQLSEVVGGVEQATKHNTEEVAKSSRS